MDAWQPAAQRNRERRTALLAKAREIARVLAARGARRIVAFGSLAVDDGGPVHDIDLLAVADTDLPFVERAHRLLADVPTDEPVDLLVYTPGEFQVVKERSSLVRRALADGIVLHEERSG